MVIRVQLKHVFEEAEGFSLVLRGARLARLDLGEKLDCFVAILIARACKDGVQVRLSILEVSHLEEHLGQAKECLIVARIMAETLLVTFESCRVALLNMLNFAEGEAEK